MERRILEVVASAVVLALILSVGLLAQDNSSKEQNRQAVQEKMQTQVRMNENWTPVGRGLNFIDEDGNGICDRYENGLRMRDNMGRVMGPGQNFIDEDGDGICDNRTTGGMHNGRGHGRHSGHGHENVGGGWRR